MPAIISDKFRIFNAKQFLESLSEGADDNDVSRSRMYFFVGRPQPWRAYLEVHAKSATNFTVGNFVYVGTNFASATFKARIAAVYDTALLLTDVGPQVTTSPAINASLKEWNGTADTAATATSGAYRYATEDYPPLPLDNAKEKITQYEELIAAKRITTNFARAVIRRYNWDIVANPKFDMWKPDYSATPAGGGGTGKTTATLQSSIANAKFYVMNSQYEVFKCLYNGENTSNLTGQNATEEPITTSPNYSSSTGLYKEATGAKYIWKYMYTIPTDDVLKFLSTDFMPIVLSTNTSRTAVKALAVAGSLDVALVESVGAGYGNNATYYAPVQGDGTDGVVKITTNGTGGISSAEIVNRGSGYTYATVALVSGNLTGGPGGTKYGLFTTYTTGGWTGLSTVASVTPTTRAAIEVILPPLGGHGFDHEEELNAKRVMTNIRLSYAEGSGDFPVDNDFRRIGIIRDPYNWNTTTLSTAETLSGLKAVKITGTSFDYVQDELITQTLASGDVAYGQVVSWTLDTNTSLVGSSGSNPTGKGTLKYIQLSDAHTHKGKVISFGGANSITGSASGAAGTIDTSASGTGSYVGLTFASGISNPEIQPNSGEFIYTENRRLISRAPDQIEDIKLVIEF